MVIEPLAATDAGAKPRPHRAYELLLGLHPAACLMGAQREDEGELSSNPARARESGVGGGRTLYRERMKEAS
jgi:hypothetical protein